MRNIINSFGDNFRYTWFLFCCRTCCLFFRSCFFNCCYRGFIFNKINTFVFVNSIILNNFINNIRVRIYNFRLIIRFVYCLIFSRYNSTICFFRLRSLSFCFFRFFGSICSCCSHCNCSCYSKYRSCNFI